MMNEFRVIIAGGRNFKDYNLLKTKCDAFLEEKRKTHEVVVISGTASGADAMGERYAQERGLAVRRFPADWNQYGKAAGYIRNCQMADNADALIAFWDGRSRGTGNMIEIARKRNMPIRVAGYPAPIQ